MRRDKNKRLQMGRHKFKGFQNILDIYLHKGMKEFERKEFENIISS